MLNYRRTSKVAISILFTAVLLYLAFKKVNIRIVYDSLTQVRLLYVALSISFFFMSLLIRALLWKKILGGNGRGIFYSLFTSIVIGQMGNNILPFRAGELLRVHSLSRREKIGKTLCFSTVIVERLFDFVSLVILSLFVSCFIRIPVFVRGGLVIIGIATVVILSLLIYIANAPKTAASIINWLEKMLPFKIKKKLDTSFNQIVLGLTSLNSLKTTGLILVLSLTCWMLVCFSYFYCLKAYNLAFSWILPPFLLVLLNIGMLVPTLPGSLGVYQFFCVVVLTYFGIEKSVALGFSFVLQAVEFVPVTVLGLFYFSRENISWRGESKGGDYVKQNITP